MSQTQTIDFKAVVKTLPTAKQQQNFKDLVRYCLGVAAYNHKDPNVFFPITNKGLKGCDSHYNRYSKQFEQLIEINHSYQNLGGNGKCKEYRFKEGFVFLDYVFEDTKQHEDSIDFDFEPQTIEIQLDALKRLTIATKEGKGARVVKTVFEANHYLRQFVTGTITPQYVAKRIDLNRAAKTYEHKNNLCDIEGDVEAFLVNKTHFAQLSGGYILNAIRQKQFFCSVSPTNGRLNTSFTSLNSDLTKYLRLDGERLKGLDIRNSQFLIFSVLLKNCLNGGKMFDFLKSNEYMSEYVGKKPYFLPLGELIETLQNIVQKEKKGADFDIFIWLSEQGRIYKNFAHRAGITDRKAKQTFFHILFGAGNKTEFSDKFKEFYPTIYSIVTKFKRATNYRYFSCMLQKIESIYFVKTILPTCYAQNMLCLTKHDSIFTTESKAKQVRRIFDDIMKAYFNDQYAVKEE